jgi:Tol biopolymer transport system component
MRRVLLLSPLLLATLIVACSRSSNDSNDTAATMAGRVVLVREQGLFVRDAGGTEQVLARTPTNTHPAFPVWSPDGTRIAYVQTTIFSQTTISDSDDQSGADWGGDIYLVQAGSSTPTLAWKHDEPGTQVQGLAWTPDGGSLLFGYDRTLVENGRYQGRVQRIERLELVTGIRTPVVQGAVYPSLSHDGTRMAYMTQDDTGGGGLWVSAADGSGAKQLVTVGQAVILGQKVLAILYPRIAPNGSAVAFAATASAQGAAPDQRSRGGGLRAAVRDLLPRSAAAHGIPMDVFHVKVADVVLTRLTRFAEDEPYPVWSVDGRMLTVFATGGLYEVAADGSSVKKIGAGAYGGQLDLR